MHTQRDHVLKKFNFDLSTTLPGSACKIFATMLLHVSFPLIWYTTWPYSEMVEFDLLTPPQGRWGGGLQVKYLRGGGGVCRLNIWEQVAAWVIPFNLIYNMTIFWRRWILTFWPHPQCRGVGGSAGKIFATMLLHVSFSLVWYATWPYSVCHNSKFKSWLRLNFDLLTPSPRTSAPSPKSTQGGQTQAFNLKSLLICFVFIVPLFACEISVKKYWQLNELMRN